MMELVNYIIPVCSIGGQDSSARVENLQYVIDGFLTRQKEVEIKLIIVEQVCGPFRPLTEQVKIPSYAKVIVVNGKTFNKGWLQNIGVAESESNNLIMADLDCCYVDDHGICGLLDFIDRNKLKWCIGWNRIYYVGKRCKDYLIKTNTLLSDDLQDLPQDKLQSHEGGIVYFDRNFLKDELGGISEFFLDLRGMDNAIATRARIASGQDLRNYNTLIHLYHPWSPMKDSPRRPYNKEMLNFTRKHPYEVNRVFIKMRQKGMLGNINHPASDVTSFYQQRTHLS
jgi:hypothetical protein